MEFSLIFHNNNQCKLDNYNFECFFPQIQDRVIRHLQDAKSFTAWNFQAYPYNFVFVSVVRFPQIVVWIGIGNCIICTILVSVIVAIDAKSYRPTIYCATDLATLKKQTVL